MVRIYVSVGLIQLFSMSTVFAQKLIPSSTAGLGLSTYRANTSASNRIVCPEMKVGIGVSKMWNRIGFYGGVTPGLLLPSISISNYAFGSIPIDEWTFLRDMNEAYSNTQFFIELPLEASYMLKQDRIFFNAGVYARWYTDPVQNPNFIWGISSNLRFKLSKQFSLSLDYLAPVNRINSTYYLNSEKLFFLKSNSFGFSLSFRPS